MAMFERQLLLEIHQFFTSMFIGGRGYQSQNCWVQNKWKALMLSPYLEMGFLKKGANVWPLQGFLVWLHLSSQGFYITFWPDMFHKIVRKVALALQRSEATNFLKKLNKVFRFSRAPYSTAKFGKSLGSARQQLANALKQGKADELKAWHEISPRMCHAFPSGIWLQLWNGKEAKDDKHVFLKLNQATTCQVLVCPDFLVCDWSFKFLWPFAIQTWIKQKASGLVLQDILLDLLAFPSAFQNEITVFLVWL